MLVKTRERRCEDVLVSHYSQVDRRVAVFLDRGQQGGAIAVPDLPRMEVIFWVQQLQSTTQIQQAPLTHIITSVGHAVNEFGRWAGSNVIHESLYEHFISLCPRRTHICSTVNYKNRFYLFLCCSAVTSSHTVDSLVFDLVRRQRNAK